ncbi:MAG: histidine phosphotransferase [Marinosulfonomonas sp.]|nr:histidine phosphotransferase [Marinosulfonomonas sp.]
MPSNASDLTSLIGSRICHDLISPLGAISNGVELLSMNGAPIGPEMSLISESVQNANARIRFFRIAFGAASATQAVGQGEIKSILHDMSRGGRLTIEWQPQGDQNRLQVKLAFLLLQCFETAMPWGGHVSVSAVGDEWAIYGQADKMKIDPDIWQVLSGGPNSGDVSAAQVHFALAPVAASEIGRRLTVECSANSARVRF